MATVLKHLRANAGNLWDRLENPVMGREFRSRMRGGRSYVITGSYALLVAACALLVYAQVPATMSGQAMGEVAPRTGRALWMWGCIIQAVLLPLMVPAFTCGAITLERERDLLELLLLTRQSPLQICLGKLGSGAGLGLILVLASVPVLALSLILGGVAPMEMVSTLCVLTTGVLAAGALGLVVSSVSAKTMSATFVTYVVAGGLILGVPIVGGLMSRASSLQESGSEWAVLVTLLAFTAASLPPALALAVFAAQLRKRRDRKPPSRLWWLLTVGGYWCVLELLMHVPLVQGLLFQGEALLFFHPVTAILGVMEPGFARANPLFPHLWWLATLVNLGTTLWLLLIATLRVRALRSS